MEGLVVPSYADNNTPCTCSSELDKVISKLKIEVDKIFKWFQHNYFELNPKNITY